MGAPKAVLPQAETEMKASKAEGWNPDFSGWSEKSVS